MIPGGIYFRGQTFSFLAGLALGDLAAITATPIADVKPLTGNIVGDSSVAALFSAAVTTSAATAGVPAGYLITISSAQSATLVPGNYVLDMRYVAGSSIGITEPVRFTITNPVTIR